MKLQLIFQMLIASIVLMLILRDLATRIYCKNHSVLEAKGFAFRHKLICRTTDQLEGINAMIFPSQRLVQISYGLMNRSRSEFHAVMLHELAHLKCGSDEFQADEAVFLAGHGAALVSFMEASLALRHNEFLFERMLRMRRLCGLQRTARNPKPPLLSAVSTRNYW